MMRTLKVAAVVLLARGFAEEVLMEGDADLAAPVEPTPTAEPPVMKETAKEPAPEAAGLEASPDVQAASGGGIPIVSAFATSVEASLGVGAGVAQVLAWLAVLSGGYVALQLVMPLMGGVIKPKRQLGQTVLIFGQCGAGKTALFFQLRDKKEVTTVSSLKPNRDKFKIETGEESEPLGPIEVVDFPGHNRFRGKSADLIKEARCIIFVVDAEDKTRLKDAAEHLYVLFTHRDVCDLHTPILIALNKTDCPAARTEKFIVDEIEREIEHMRYSRSVTLEGEDQADSYLGIDGEKFKLIEHAPCPVEVCRVSAKKAQLGPIHEFLRNQFA